MKLRSARLVVVATATVMVSGCGANDALPDQPTPTSSSWSPGVSAVFNETDVFFARQMVPHHQQAVEIASFAESAGAAPGVLELAGRIEAAKGPEITTMSGWLIAWGENVPDQNGAVDHGGMGHERMPGMMTDEEMATLEATHGVEFDRMFLDAMIAHAEGAILIAQVEQADGQNSSALDLAARIASQQSAEITEITEVQQMLR